MRHSVHRWSAFLAGLILIGTCTSASAQSFVDRLDTKLTYSLAAPMSALQEESSSDAPRFSEFLSLPEGFLKTPRNGYDRIPYPIDVPLYFESPVIDTSLRPFMLYHEFPESSVLGGGDLFVQAMQARFAVTDRLAIIATSDGHSDLETDNLPDGEGWNNLALGFKYAFYMEEGTIATAGFRWTLSNGSRDVFMGFEDEISFFVSGAKQMGRLTATGGLTARLAAGSEGNDVVHWDASLAYELFRGIFPIVEYHGLVYTANGSRPGFEAVRDGLLDYANLGAGDVRGSTAHWATLGTRFRCGDHASFGVGYSFSLVPSSNNDIMDRRVMIDWVLTY